MNTQQALAAQDNLFMSGYKIDKEASTFTQIIYISMRGDENQEITTFDNGVTYHLNPEGMPTPQVTSDVGNQLSLF